MVGEMQRSCVFAWLTTFCFFCLLLWSTQFRRRVGSCNLTFLQFPTTVASVQSWLRGNSQSQNRDLSVSPLLQIQSLYLGGGCLDRLVLGGDIVAWTLYLLPLHVSGGKTLGGMLGIFPRWTWLFLKIWQIHPRSRYFSISIQVMGI